MNKSTIPVLGPYIDAWNLAMHDDRDGLADARRGHFWGNIGANFASWLIDGVMYTTLLLMLLEGTDADTNTKYMTIIGSLPGIITILQLLSPIIFERMPRRRGLIFLLRGINYVLNIVMYPLIVALPLEVDLKASLFIACLILKQVSLSLSNPAIDDWHIYSLAEFCRSDYFAMKSVLFTVISAVVSLVIGLYMDFFKANNLALVGILILRGIAILFVILEYKSFLHMPEPEYNKGLGGRPTFGQIFTAPMRSKPFMIAVAISVMSTMATGFTGAFYSTYLLDEAGANLSYTYQSIVSVVAIPFTVIMMPFWNRQIHKHGWLPTLAVSMALNSVIYLLNALVTKETAFLYIISSAYGAIVGGGASLAMTNLHYLRTPDDLRNACLAFYAVCGAVASSVSSILGGWFIALTNGKTLNLFGLTLQNRSYMQLVTLGLYWIAILGVTILIKADKNAETEQARKKSAE